MQLDDRLRDGQTEPAYATAFAFDIWPPVEALEDVRQRLRCDTPARIPNAQYQRFVAVVDGHADLAAARGELDRIAYQICHHLLEALGVQIERGDGPPDGHCQFHSLLLRKERRLVGDTLNDRRYVARSTLEDNHPGVELAELQQHVDQFGEPLGTQIHRSERLALVLGELVLALGKELAEGFDHRQWRAQIMRHPCDEVVLKR